MKPSADSLPGADLETASAFVAASGLIVDEVTNPTVSGHADLGTDHHTPWGVVHGGVYTTLVESAGSIGASYAVSERGEFAVGIHNATDFLRPTTGAHVAVEGAALHQGRTQQLWEVIITDTASGKVLSRGQLRLQNVPMPKEAN